MTKTEIKALLNVNAASSKYHTITDHNFWITRNKVCPYCRLGSIPIHKSCLDENGNWIVKQKDIIKCEKEHIIL